MCEVLLHACWGVNYLDVGRWVCRLNLDGVNIVLPISAVLGMREVEGVVVVCTGKSRGWEKLGTRLRDGR